MDCFFYASLIVASTVNLTFDIWIQKFSINLAGELLNGILQFFFIIDIQWLLLIFIFSKIFKVSRKEMAIILGFNNFMYIIRIIS